MRNPCQEQLEDVCTAIWCNLNVSDNVIGHNQNVIQTTLTGQRSSPHYNAVHCDTIILKEAYMPVYMKQFSNWKTTQKSRSTYWNSCDLILFFDIFINLKYFFNKTSPPQSTLDDHHDGDYYDDYDNAKDLSAISVTVIWPTIWFLSPPLLTAATHRGSNYQCTAFRPRYSALCTASMLCCTVMLWTALLVHCNEQRFDVSLPCTQLHCLNSNTLCLTVNRFKSLQCISVTVDRICVVSFAVPLRYLVTF